MPKKGCNTAALTARGSATSGYTGNAAAEGAHCRMLGTGYLTEYAPSLGLGSKIQAVREIVESIADTNATVLIRGESGVGKDVVARAIHAASVRHDAPFVKVNCAALPAGLLE